MRTGWANLSSIRFGLVKDTQLKAPGGSVQAGGTDAQILNRPNFEQGITESYPDDGFRAPRSRLGLPDESHSVA